MIVLVRIDDRLIHGQVVVGWANAMKATHLIVVDDPVAHDELQQSFMKMAVPPPLKVGFLTVDEAVERFAHPASDGKAAKERLIVLMPSPREAVELVRRGVVLKEINVGGMRFARGKREVLKSVYVSPDDVGMLHKLASFGVKLVGMMVPTDHPVDLVKLLPC